MTKRHRTQLILLAAFLPLLALAQSADERDSDPEALKRFLRDPATRVDRDPHGDFGESVDYLQSGSRVEVGGGFACVYHAMKSTPEHAGWTRQTYASNNTVCKKYVVEGDPARGAEVVPQVPNSSYPQVCGASLRSDNTRATTCNFAASGETQQLHFRANFKNAGAGASASVQAVLDGKDIACDAGSVPQTTSAAANPAIYCRVTMQEPARSMHEVVFKSQWTNAAIDKTAFAIR